MNYPQISVLTLVHQRAQHLTNLMTGLDAAALRPDELVIVYMNEPQSYNLPSVSYTVQEKHITSDQTKIPLAAARNLAASAASGDLLIFLDVDCIPDAQLTVRYRKMLSAFKGLLMGTIFYLPQSFNKAQWQFQDLVRQGVPHPRRPVINAEALQETTRYELFWSLNFALHRQTLEQIGGFDEQYQGYGGEDTDFAFTTRQKDIPFALGDARAYHQPHAVHQPPLQHFQDIIINARRFKQKWGNWPMDGWLRQFADLSLIQWQPDAEDIVILQPPTAAAVQRSRKETPAGF